jgi:hypothetical protein
MSLTPTHDRIMTKIAVTDLWSGYQGYKKHRAQGGGVVGGLAKGVGYGAAGTVLGGAGQVGGSLLGRRLGGAKGALAGQLIGGLTGGALPGMHARKKRMQFTSTPKAPKVTT